MITMTLPELTAFFAEQKLPKFRAQQVYQWLHQKNAASYDEMSNLPQALRTQLAAVCPIPFPQIERKQVSAIDGTTKYLYRFPDGVCIETVVMRYTHGNSICVSTQVGCRMGCKFCASTLGGLQRNLTAYEILAQVYASERDLGESMDSLVLMGIGEPLDNYDNVMRFLKLLSSPEGHNLSLRHVSLSTCGLVDRIDQLAEENLQLTLSISLHAPDDAHRQELMPVAKRWSVDELLAACKRYTDKTGRRISYEYALVSGVNDTPECAKALADRLRGLLAHVNLIPVNPVAERGFSPSDRRRVAAFQKTLEQYHINATVRRRLGADIDAACGQLRKSHAEEQNANQNL